VLNIFEIQYILLNSLALVGCIKFKFAPDNSLSTPVSPPAFTRTNSAIEGTQVMLVVIQEFFCQIAEKTFRYFTAYYLMSPYLCLRHIIVAILLSHGNGCHCYQPSRDSLRCNDDCQTINQLNA